MQEKATTKDFMPKKKLAIFALTSCEGCQFEMLSCYEDFEKILRFYDVINFRLGQEINLPGPFDVSIVEGNPVGTINRRKRCQVCKRPEERENRHLYKWKFFYLLQVFNKI